MKLLLLIVIVGILVYLFLKFCLYQYRPFFLSKTFREIEQMYNRLFTAAEKELSSAIERLEKWHSGDKVVRTVHSEEQVMESINAAKAAKAREEKLHEKFLRLRERFIQDPNKLSESIVSYRRYLEVRLKWQQNAAMFGHAVTSGVMSFDEMMAVSKEATIVLEECERKLDILLGN